MNKRFLSLGMIVPFIAAGALATAPAASAHEKDDDASVECKLKAEINDDEDEIKVKLKVDSEGDQGKKFRVKIWQNGTSILKTTKWDKDGEFTIRKTVDEEDGRYFRAYVKNIETGDDDTCRVRASKED